MYTGRLICGVGDGGGVLRGGVVVGGVVSCVAGAAASFMIGGVVGAGG